MSFFCYNQQKKRLKLISDTHEKNAIFCPKKKEILLEIQSNMSCEAYKFWMQYCWKTE